MRTRRLLRHALWVPAIILSLFTAFCLAAWIGSAIPRNADWQEPDEGIPIMIATNGVHTEIVMPIITPIKDWRATFPAAALPRPGDGWLPTHIAVGWGEREVFLNTPTWTDLAPSTALRIIFRGGDGLVRVAPYVNPQPSEHYRVLQLRPAEYRRLSERVAQALPKLRPGEKRDEFVGFDRATYNYAANGRYTLGNTCNQWVSDTLAYAGVRVGAWTPLAGGVMKWFPDRANQGAPPSFDRRR